ncbi:MAG: PIN domain-containing protein [Mucilaginibacter sp.]|nr:PIN domain-containing protein [Mucilaginibacter sp.]
MAYKKLFIDSDILLDTVLIRIPFFDDSLKVTSLAGDERFICSTTVHCLLNVHYLAKKKYGERLARQSVAALAKKMKIVIEDGETINRAVESDFIDFEDAVQYYAAINGECDVIITRNTKDYKQATIPVLTAEEFLRQL